MTGFHDAGFLGAAVGCPEEIKKWDQRPDGVGFNLLPLPGCVDDFSTPGFGLLDARKRACREIALVNGPIEHPLNDRHRIDSAGGVPTVLVRPSREVVGLERARLHRFPDRLNEAFQVVLVLVVGDRLAIVFYPIEIALGIFRSKACKKCKKDKWAILDSNQ